MIGDNIMNEQEQLVYFKQQQAYVDKYMKQIIQIYAGKFVIVYNNRIVDSDSNEIELGKRHQLRGRFDFDLPALVTKIPQTLEEHLQEIKKRDEPDYLESPETQ